MTMTTKKGTATAKSINNDDNEKRQQLKLNRQFGDNNKDNGSRTGNYNNKDGNGIGNEKQRKRQRKRQRQDSRTALSLLI